MAHGFAITWRDDKRRDMLRDRINRGGQMRAIMTIFLVCLAGVVQSQSLKDPAAVELLHGWRENGQHIAGIKIDLDKGWKTYWRAPGNAGIPPEIYWTGSSNIAAASILWPEPIVSTDAGITTIGYSGSVILPLVLRPKDPDKPIKVDAVLNYGVCKDLCIPARATLIGTLTPDKVTDMSRINAARASRIKLARPNEARMDCRITPVKGGFKIEAGLTGTMRGALSYATIEYPGTDIFARDVEIRSKAGKRIVLHTVLEDYSTNPRLIDRTQFRITLFAKDRVREIRGCPAS